MYQIGADDSGLLVIPVSGWRIHTILHHDAGSKYTAAARIRDRVNFDGAVALNN